MIKSLNQRLADLAHELRDSLFPESKSVTFDFDSTSNKQHGKKMEGVCMNYKGFESLDTIQAFDEHGLQYWNDVRPGSTFTSNGIAEIVHEVFHRMPRRLRRYGRADSGFCNSGFFNACFAKSVGFVCYMRDNMSGPLIGNVTDWKAQNPKRQSRVTFYDGRECEYGETLYALEGCPHVLRVVFIRAPKTGTSPTMFRHESDYDYHAWVTNIGEHEMNFERLIFFYRKRGNAENHVKELKYGLDLKHYPCLKLNANRAYGLIAAYTYNLMRFLSLKSNPRHPQLAKAIRFRFFHLPVQVVRHAREVTFRFMDHHYEEVRRWLLIIKNLQLGNA